MNEAPQQELSFEEREHRALIAEQKMINAKKNLHASFAAIANAALDALASRVRVIILVVLMASLFAYSMIDPSVLRVASATIFGLLLILSGQLKRSKNDD